MRESISTNWPELDWQSWQSTADTLHLWTQIVGKTRLELTPLQPHWWNVTLHVTPRGLSTGTMFSGDDLVEVEFDFHEHQLLFHHSARGSIAVPLRAQSVANFFAEYKRTLASLGIHAAINPHPQEIPGATPFDQDTNHNSYDPESVLRFWRILASTLKVMQQFSADFLGQASPVHFFWGSFDLAVTRFSGRVAPPRPGVITSEAYSRECISAGFWPGNGGMGEAAFYAYAAPAPAGLDKAKILPGSASFNAKLGEFILTYKDLLAEASPESALMDFLQSTYAVAADLAKWDRATLERHPPK